MGNPFFLSPDLNLYGDHRAEFYYYSNQQLMARYHLERQSSYLGPIGNFNWLQPYQLGYQSQLSHWNGIPFLPRYDHCPLAPESVEKVELVMSYVQQVKQIIDLGYFPLDNGTIFSMRDPKALDYIGVSFFNNRYGLYANFYTEIMCRQLLSGGDKYYRTIPGALMHFETSLHDPVFYELYNYFVNILWIFRSYLTPYAQEELAFHGVQIRGVTVDRLVTFFEHHEVDVGNVVPITEQWWDRAIYVRRKRINHKPFTYTLNVESNQATKGVIRMYMGPKYKDAKQLQHLRKQFFLLDQYVYELNAGWNNVTRNSRDYHRTIGERTSYKQLYRRTLQRTANNEEENDAMELPCGWPNRLLLPKGRQSSTGFPITFYFIITPYSASQRAKDATARQVNPCAIGAGVEQIDDLPIGFPFDRNIDVTAFFNENSFFKHVNIYHEG